MYLKRVELVGFKSFANKISLEFGKGITGLVGPNGCGKSNISDAIRWVLGEQSVRTLRGHRLEDVIFAGTDGRRAFGMAEVQLVLDNEDRYLPVDFSEVAVCRKVYRSGDSEFTINRKVCRLKDIHDLFTDTGLGKDGCAVIGQGQFDTILSANPQERRVLIEETAGIVKYRQRKEQALAKMGQADTDLIRVRDILAEVNGQLLPLKNEADKTRAYQELANRILAAELDLYCLRLTTLEQERTRVREHLKEKEIAGEKLEEGYQAVEKEIGESQVLLSKLEQDMDHLQSGLLEVNENLSRVVHDVDRTQERSSNTERRNAEITEQLRSEQRTRDELRTQAVELEKALQEARNTREQIGADLTDKEIRLGRIREEHAADRNDLAALKDDFLVFMRQAADLRNTQRNYEQRTSAIDKQMERIDQSIHQMVDAIDDAIARKSAIAEKQKTLTQQLTTQQSEHERLTLALKQSVTAENAAQTEETQQADRYQRGRSRLGALSELADNYEGYNQSVRKLLKARLSVDLHGTVADIITVPPTLEVAVEVALGASLQHVIAGSENDAKRAIEWLKQNKSGRVTFLPLDAMRAGGFPTSVQKHLSAPGVLGVALHLVDFEAKYHVVVASLLGRIVVTEDVDTALTVRSNLSSFARIVTVEGEVVFPSGAITGGSVAGKGSGLLARKNEISRLRSSLREQKRLLAAATRTREGAVNRTVAIRDTLQLVTVSITKMETELHGLAQELRQAETELDRLNLARDQYVSEKQTLLDEKAHLRAEFERSNRHVAKTEADEQARRTAMVSLEERLQAKEEELTVLTQAVTEDKVRMAETKGQVQQLEDKRNASRRRAAETDEKMTLLRQQLHQNQQDATELQAQLTSLRSEEERFRKSKEEIVGNIQTHRRKRESLQTTMVRQNEVFRSMRSRLSAVQRQIHNLQLELNALDLEFSQIQNELADRQTQAQAVATRSVSRSRHELEKALDQWRQQVGDIGPVNPQAISEYEAVRERSEFLERQTKDLEQARSALKAVIAEMDTTSKQRFVATFRQLRQEFRALFSELFGGGRADLILNQPEELLTTGIEIVAQPPGKKLQNLLLLSGGERALTAIALIFATLAVRPAPFCVFDEVDAALDDANLQRFGGVMKDFSKTTQFLVITHRQGTMDVADRLYGVTMGDSAVSQLISVSLAEAQCQ